MKTSDKVLQRVIQRMTTSGTTAESEWKQE